MSNVTFEIFKDAGGKTASKKKQPQSYVFVGDDPYRGGERTPQEWRKLFLGLGAMATGSNGSRLGSNEFGLEILYNGLVTMYEAACKALGTDTVDAAIEETWAEVVKSDAERAAKVRARMAANGEESDEEPEPEPTPVKTKTKK
jgi:hypothetical protein